MPAKEAKARIKINKLLEEAGWRLLYKIAKLLQLNVKDLLIENKESVNK
jgi:hypothetical protein